MDIQHLPQQIAGPILGWLPDEYLYSLLARNHYFHGHRDVVETIREFFGSSNTSFTEIEELVSRTGGGLGTAREILDGHTLLRFYRLFMTRHDELVLTSGRLKIDSLLRFPLALRTCRFNAQPQVQLKNCPVCLAGDRERIGMTYWRTEHQLPGVCVCLTHNQPLCSARERPCFGWQTPTLKGLCATHKAFRMPHTFERICDLSRSIVEAASSKVEGNARIQKNRRQMRERFRDDGAIRQSGEFSEYPNNATVNLCASFVAYSAVLRLHPEFSSLPDNVNKAYFKLTQFLRGRGVITPLEVMVILAWNESSFYRT